MNDFFDSTENNIELRLLVVLYAVLRESRRDACDPVTPRLDFPTFGRV